MKVLTIIGARPQFVKAAVLSRIFSKMEGVEELLVHTGQHFDEKMSQIFFDEMEIPKPHYNLEINSVGHGAMTGRMLEGIEALIIKEKPDWILVYGDTNSTIAGALAARKLNVKVAHVEAGLRSFNMQMPEEINRILTDRISNNLYAPTQTAIDNLKREGFDNFDVNIVLSGDVMQDAAYFYADKAEEKSSLSKEFLKGDFVLSTIHRQENTDDANRLKNIVNALNTIHETTRVVLPLHPRTKKTIANLGLSLNVDVIEPVGYFDMIQMLKHCSLVMTDSGGLQKEAFFFKKNCVTLRDQTEWTELIENGFNILVGADEKLILQGFEKMKTIKNNFDVNLYGNGSAGEKIANHLLKTN
jgi:UDP-GlcNAc3NAcA epimerase